MPHKLYIYYISKLSRWIAYQPNQCSGSQPAFAPRGWLMRVLMSFNNNWVTKSELACLRSINPQLESTPTQSERAQMVAGALVLKVSTSVFWAIHHQPWFLEKTPLRHSLTAHPYLYMLSGSFFHYWHHEAICCRCNALSLIQLLFQLQALFFWVSVRCVIWFYCSVMWKSEVSVKWMRF